MLRTAATARSGRLNDGLGRRLRTSVPGRAGSGGRGQDVRAEGEHHKQRDQDDGELPEAPLDAPPAAVDGRVTAERAAEAGPARLQQDGQRQGDGDDQLAGGQNGVHGARSSSMTAGWYATSEWPVIPGHRGSPARSQMVGATSASTPSRSSAPTTAAPATSTGTGCREWAVTGSPV